MINLTYEQKQTIGFEYVLELLTPASCFGAEKSRHLTPYERSEQNRLFTELDNIERIKKNYDNLRPEIEKLNRIFGHFKDIRQSLTRGEDYCYNEIELFELKHFLIQFSQLIPVFGQLNEVCALEAVEFFDTEAFLDLLDPDHKRVPSFYISESYSDALREIRKEKKNIEIAIRTEESKALKENLMAQRVRVVVREEEEEQRIRRDITQKLRPALPKLLHNVRMLADLDLLIQKARLAKTYDCAKPEIRDDRLSFEAMLHPQIADVLSDKHKKFTPVSICLQNGTSVITGANMGGKSVALKTTALNTLLVLCGFYPFAKSACVPMFEEIHFVAEDRQSIDKGLSSFGAEIVQLDEVIQASKRAFCLIILDEFARGTNPDEGAVIVQAVAKFFNSMESMTLLTTHYDNVAEFAKVHYQVIGLKDVDVEALRSEIASAQGSGVDIISRHMNYGLYQVFGRADCPKDALNICRMLALDEDILNIIEKSY